MANERKKLPGALLLLLSALGFLFSLITALIALLGAPLLADSAASFSDRLPILSSGMLALVMALLNLPTLILSIRYLLGKSVNVRKASLFKPASVFILVWAAVLAAGFFTARNSTFPLLLAMLTVFAVSIPVWWLVEFCRRGLPRSLALREWGTLAVGLSAAPLVIMATEILLVVLIGVVVFFALSAQPGAIAQISEVFQNIELYQGSLEQLEKMLYELARNPVVASALFLVVGLIAPFIEEIFKPMAVWFLLNRPLKEHEGFSLGLISGGAFALLESAGLVGQIGADTWLTAVALRAATGLLHIGLSGLVGYGLVRAWNRKSFARSLLYLLAAGGLHGAWNSLALLSGFTTTALPAASAEFQPSLGGTLTVFGMFFVFIAVLLIVLRLNRDLRRKNTETAVDGIESPPE